MVLLLDSLSYILPIVILVILYYLYYQIFILGYIRRIKKAIKKNNIEKAERMKAVALKRQPLKMQRLLKKHNLIKEKDVLSEFEIENEFVEDNSSLKVKYTIGRKDLAKYSLWSYLTNIPKSVKIIFLVFYSMLFCSLLFTSFEAILVLLILTIGYIVTSWFHFNNLYDRNTKISLVLSLSADNIIITKKGKTYIINNDRISNCYNTKKYIYIILNNKIVIIIPKDAIDEGKLQEIVSIINKWVISNK